MKKGLKGFLGIGSSNRVNNHIRFPSDGHSSRKSKQSRQQRHARRSSEPRKWRPTGGTRSTRKPTNTSCRAHKPGVPRGPASSAKAQPNRRRCGRRTTLGPTQILKNKPEEQSNLQPKGLAKEEQRSLPTPARLSWPNTASELRPASPVGDAPNPCLQLFSDWRSRSQLGPTDRERPLGEDQETNGESKAGHSSQTAIPRTVPYTPIGQYRQDMSEECPATFQACQNPSSVVGADICPTVLWALSTAILDKHGKAPPTCPWASIVLWVPTFTLPGEHGKNPLCASGHQQCDRHQHQPYHKKTMQPPTCI